MKRRTLLIAATSVLAALVLGVIAGALVMYSGVYDIAASSAHAEWERTLITVLKRRSVTQAADEIVPPSLEDAALIRRGLVLYRDHCLTCHGAPGVARSRIGTGMNPNPPPLEQAVNRWSPAEIYWITGHGLKMAGMPAFELGEEPRDLWALTAFVVRMNTLSPAEYRRMVAEVDNDADGGAPVAWVAPEGGWEQLRASGNAARGRALISQKGCGACHVVPGVAAAQGLVGPPLTNWSRRHYIAGRLVNSPRQLVAWVMDPPSIDPATAMPPLGVTEQEAWDIAAYLYTLEGDAAGEVPPQPAAVSPD